MTNLAQSYLTITRRVAVLYGVTGWVAHSCVTVPILLAWRVNARFLLCSDFLSCWALDPALRPCVLISSVMCTDKFASGDVRSCEHAFVDIIRELRAACFFVFAFLDVSSIVVVFASNACVPPGGPAISAHGQHTFASDIHRPSCNCQHLLFRACFCEQHSGVARVFFQMRIPRREYESRCLCVEGVHAARRSGN